MALAERALRKQPKGRPQPRLAPPLPARHGAKAFTALASEVGYELYPWQVTAAKYLTALDRNNNWLFPEVAIVVARQSGKTTLLVPLIVGRLLAGRRISHTAQTRTLPREVFTEVADILLDQHADQFAKRGGRVIPPRWANGQEVIRLKNGGVYRIVAATRGGSRGPSNDDVIVDELRELEDLEYIAAAKPSLAASKNPQMVYLSNAGTEASIVLNSLRKRRDDDRSLAYLEWSAAPERAVDDMAGWLEANPSVGHMPAKLDTLEREFQAHLLGDMMPTFETEYLCRWVVTMKPALLPAEVWEAQAQHLPEPRRSVMGIALDASGDRASAAVAWQRPDGTYGLRLVADRTGDPVDLDVFGPELVALANRIGVQTVVYDPYDEHLARFFRKPVPMNGREYANACATFVRLLEGGQLGHEDADEIGTDIANASRKHVGRDAWMAVKSSDDKPITALLAAIRAVEKAYRPRVNAPRVL